MDVDRTEMCRRCGKPFPAEAFPLTIGSRTIVLRTTVCASCRDPGPVPPSGVGRLTKWQRICPPHYQRDLPAGLLARSWVAGVLSWQYGPQGLLIVGDTGTGKTWVMWRLLRRLLDESCNVVTLDAVTYRSGLANAAREGETENYVRRLSRADVLYWDDFGQTHLSAASSEMLLHVVEQRTSYQRPLLLTSQYRGDALELQFERPEMGAAVRRRINEFCQVVLADATTAI